MWICLYVISGIWNISKEGGVSVGILMRWVSVLRFSEIVIKSCLTWWLRWDRGVDLLPIIFFSMLLEIYFSFLGENLIALVLYSSCSLRSVGVMQSSTSISSKGVDFTALSINISAPFWAASRSLACLVVCMVCPHMMLPYSNLEWILYLFVIILTRGLNERLLSIIIPNILWLETLLRDTPFMVSGTGGGLAVPYPGIFWTYDW